MAIQSIEALFQTELKDVYDAEKRLTKALPKMAKGASSEELKQAFEEHLEVTKGQVTRLEQVFQAIGAKPQAKTCEAMKGLIQEGEETMNEDGEESLIDIAVVGAARRVEHYEMAAYKSLIALAAHLEQGDQVQDLLQQTLEEEEEADRVLAELADTLVEEMTGESEEDDEEEGEDMEMEDEEDMEEEEEAAPAPTSRRR
jgi:ferritin-like metal-binding protein YciE